ncbi:DUF2232 domain-containing protein [Methylococcus sp. EFPC2]|uniref:DUF2232 domain-containing protein n=1 Tax=Methylococcus sp. EFPC2 TaxID=2812648 RepID=UPI0019683087|nr:DUF2232 domain-containing protein [Methylococcus sp. EFPC2]QSA98660.1 DUF2232 domain-containing protein [Methylococcus sp. EFPC2]
MREFAAYTMRGPYHAIFLVGLFGILSLLFMPLALPGVAALALVSLRLGLRSAGYVMVGALVPVLVGWWLIPMKAVVPFPHVFVLWGISLLAAEILRRKESHGLTAAAVTLACALIVITLHLATGDPADYWQGERVADAVGTVPAVDEDDLRKAGTPPRLLDGLIALLLGVVAYAAVLLGRWWQSLLYNPGGFGAEFRRLRLPKGALPLTALILLASSQIDTTLLDDLFIASLLMYFFAGLAVIHAIAHKRRLKNAWLSPLYLALAVLPQFAVVGVAFLGALDLFAHFRGKPK